MTIALQSQGTMSESVEMYLVMTALERKGNQPVQLSLLAEKLSISTVSANEMCHKLAERGLIDYQPYKGVTLTAKGELLAQRVLSRRRVWESFLTNDLDIELQEAREIACQLEHITSDKLIEALAAFLEQPAPTRLVEPGQPVCPLTTLTAGQRGQVVAMTGADVTKAFLDAQGLQIGSLVVVLAVGKDGAYLLDLSERHLSLAQPVAEHIKVAVLAD